MRYKNGSPVKLYVLTNQADGDPEAFTNLAQARGAKKADERMGLKVVLATYDLREAK